MSSLFSPITFRSVTLKNRIALSPMCQYASVEGHPNDWQLMHLGARAAGGAGLVMTEATSVVPEGRISPWDAGIWEDSQIDSWKRIIEFIRNQGSVAGMQLAHAGRKASADYPWKGGKSLSEADGGWVTKAPTPEAFGLHLTKVPQEMTLEEISILVESFGKSAYRALKAGVQVVEIHAGHGYVLHEFLSPLTNKRKDQYGGSFENRTRILLEIVKEVRRVWPHDLPLFVRLSTTDWDENGWSLSDSVKLSQTLGQMGVDLIDSSSGFVAPSATPYPVKPLWQVELAETIKREANIKTGAVGFINNPLDAQKIIDDGKADIILLGREFLRQPHWPMFAAKELGVDLLTTGSVRIAHWIK